MKSEEYDLNTEANSSLYNVVQDVGEPGEPPVDPSMRIITRMVKTPLRRPSVNLHSSKHIFKTFKGLEIRMTLDSLENKRKEKQEIQAKDAGKQKRAVERDGYKLPNYVPKRTFRSGVPFTPSQSAPQQSSKPNLPKKAPSLVLCDILRVEKRDLTRLPTKKPKERAKTGHQIYPNGAFHCDSFKARPKTHRPPKKVHRQQFNFSLLEDNDTAQEIENQDYLQTEFLQLINSGYFYPSISYNPSLVLKSGKQVDAIAAPKTPGLDFNIKQKFY